MNTGGTTCNYSPNRPGKPYWDGLQVGVGRPHPNYSADESAKKPIPYGCKFVGRAT